MTGLIKRQRVAPVSTKPEPQDAETVFAAAMEIPAGTERQLGESQAPEFGVKIVQVLRRGVHKLRGITARASQPAVKDFRLSMTALSEMAEIAATKFHGNPLLPRSAGLRPGVD